MSGIKISKQQSTLIKGVAILFICFHNFAHWIDRTPSENEFDFKAERLVQFLDVRFFEFPVDYFFSFFGHYGVQLFIFFSAYCYFTKKNELSQKSHFSFLRGRFVKIGIPLGLAAIVTGLLRILILVKDNPGVSAWAYCDTLFSPSVWAIAKMFCITMFIPGREFSGQGPWWFISLIMMFYLFLPLLLKITPSVKNLLLVNLACFIMMYLSDMYLGWFNIRFTILGHLPEIYLGFFVANLSRESSERIDAFKYKNLCIIPLLLLVALLNSMQFFWYFTAIPATIAFYYLFKAISSISGKTMTKLLSLLGSLSLYIFLINGVVRAIFIKFIHDDMAQIEHLALMLTSITVTVIIAALLFKIDHRIQTNLKTHLSR